MTVYSVDSLKMGLRSLREHKESLLADDNPVPVRQNGFVPAEEFYSLRLGGNGLLTILMSYYGDEKDKHEIEFLDHATNECISLGYFPAYGFSKIDQGCCPRPPYLLCNLTQDGRHVVLFGPLRYTQSLISSSNTTPVIAIYQLTPPMQLYEKRFKNTPFIKCDPCGIAVSSPSILQREYKVAIVTFNSAIILLDMLTLERSTLQLESVGLKEQLICYHYHGELGEKCLDFSPDGRFLSLSCYLQSSTTHACLIIDVSTLEPLCFAHHKIYYGWLRWLFPVFSVCGMKFVLSTISDFEDEHDESKYELRFFKISGLQSLKVLCRVVILECVPPKLVDQLPLPQDMITFLGGGRLTGMLEESLPSHVRRGKCETCKCNLL